MFQNNGVCSFWSKKISLPNVLCEKVNFRHPKSTYPANEPVFFDKNNGVNIPKFEHRWVNWLLSINKTCTTKEQISAVSTFNFEIGVFILKALDFSPGGCHVSGSC
jgi:hypothetical protein